MASLALDDIWDAPIAPSPPRSTRRASPAQDDDDDGDAPRPSKRTRSTLFLESDDDEAPAEPARYTSRVAAPNRPDIDALFDDLDDGPDGFQPLAPALDLDALRRQADAQNAKARQLNLDLPGTSHGEGDKDKEDEDTGNAGKRKGKDGPKERKKLPKLDEARLLGEDGFPALVRQSTHFKPRGKGHEAADLNRLLQVYQFWTHKMYPKNQFRDSVQRVEKLCHSKRMHVSLSVWRDESKGLINGRARDKDGGSDVDEDGGNSDTSDRDADPTASSAAPDNTCGEEQLPSSRAPSRPPSSASERTSMDDLDDFDMDAIIREDEERQAAAARAARAAATPTAPAKVPAALNTDDDEAMWDQLMGDLPDELGPTPPRLPSTSAQRGAARPRPPPDDDEEMWDVVQEMEAEADGARPNGGVALTLDAGTSGSSTTAGASEPATNDEGWDEMYL